MARSHSDFTGRLPSWRIDDGGKEEAVLWVVRSGNWWCDTGHEVDTIEREFARYM